MSERIVSPGVFVNEIDQSQLPRAVDEIGAAIIGPTTKGPAQVPTKVRSLQEYQNVFGGFTDESYVPYTVDEYFRGGGTNMTVTRLLYEGGYTLSNGMIAIGAKTGSTTYVTHILAPTQTVSPTNATFESSSLIDLNSGSFVLTWSGSFTSIGVDAGIGFTSWDRGNGSGITASLNPASNTYITKILGQSAKSINYPLYVLYDAWNGGISWNYTNVSASIAVMPTYALPTDYSWASTPWVISQPVNGFTENLFKIHTLSHGTAANYEIWTGIRDIRLGTETGDPDGYGSFTLVVRRMNTKNIPNSPFSSEDTDSMPDVLETYEGVNLNPNSTNYIARRVGTKYMTINDQGEVKYYGDYDNISQYIRVEVAAAVDTRALSSVYVPFGHGTIYSTVPAQTMKFTGSYGSDSASSKYLAGPYVWSSQTRNSLYSANNYYGFAAPASYARNYSFLQPIYNSAAYTTTLPASRVTMSLYDFNQAAAANYPSITSKYSGSIGAALDAGTFTSNIKLDTRKFMIPFQGGFDGIRPNVIKRAGQYITPDNTFGFDCTADTSSGSLAYSKAMTLLSNTDYYDFNLLLTPGIIDKHHSTVTGQARNLVEQRGDAFYVMDLHKIDATVTEATTQAASLDSNYTATYYPWVKIMDTRKNLPVWVPPSVVIPGVLAFNDKVAAPWYAPAGLTRGGLTRVSQTYSNLSKANRDDLYVARINPIANFPNDGVVVWGQKTLQIVPSALDRVSVRRLLITVKKFIASATRYLVFEQNTTQTRLRFLNIVNPYLESVRQQQGLYAFRAVMDGTNNTPDLIDRNILYGQLFLQPTRTAEFIVLDFNIQPTGASFGG